jgi:hypothetical protein
MEKLIRLATPTNLGKVEQPLVEVSFPPAPVTPTWKPVCEKLLKIKKQGNCKSRPVVENVCKLLRI